MTTIDRILAHCTPETCGSFAAYTVRHEPDERTLALLASYLDAFYSDPADLAYSVNLNGWSALVSRAFDHETPPIPARYVHRF